MNTATRAIRSTVEPLKLPDGGELTYQIHGREHDGIPVLLIRPLGGNDGAVGRARTLLPSVQWNPATSGAVATAGL